MKVIQFDDETSTDQKIEDDKNKKYPSRENTPEIVAKLRGVPASHSIKIVEFDKVGKPVEKVQKNFLNKKKIKIIEFD